MPPKMLSETTPAYAHTGARLSTSISTSPSDKKLLFISDNPDEEKNLSKLITEFWNVEDSELVVMEYGTASVARIHRRMLYMSRRQKLSHVDNLESYFMACLMRKKGVKVDTERTDEFYEQYVARQRERGQ